jgi:hypothetical protein
MFCHQDGIISREQSVPAMPSFVIKYSNTILGFKASLRRIYLVKVALSDRDMETQGPRPWKARHLSKDMLISCYIDKYQEYIRLYKNKKCFL